MTSTARTLDQPRGPRSTVFPRSTPDAFGRLAEHIARLIGTARFLVVQSLIILAWLAINAGHYPSALRCDKYPFNFLTLVLSLQAAYAAPLILLAQNRQDDRDRVIAAEERRVGEQVQSTSTYVTIELAALRQAQAGHVTRDYLNAALARQAEVIVRHLTSQPDMPMPTSTSRPV